MSAILTRAFPALLAAAVHAASIHGTVVENLTGYPIARATLTVEALSRKGDLSSVRTNLSGIFEFSGLPAGTYRLYAAKAGFAPVEYGQKRWFSPGMPIELGAGDTADLAIRMPRYGAISGTLLDENDVGLTGHEVAVYTDTRPPRLVAHAPTDDRGVYRLGNLRPGMYLVRSLAKEYDDESYLPTFYRDSPRLDEAHAIGVTLDGENEHLDFHPSPGRLYTLSGRVNTPIHGVVVTLSSDTGTETASTNDNGEFTFKPTAPGPYELLAVVPSDRRGGRSAAFQTLTLDRNMTVFENPASLPGVQFGFLDTAGRPMNMPEGSVMLRRKDPAADGTIEVVKSGDDITLLPGRWEFAIQPAASYCAVRFEPQPAGGRADAWNEILLPAGSRTIVKFVLSFSPATISGTVRNTNGDAVAGIPVFVEPHDLNPRERLEPLRTTTTGVDGHYEIAGLAAGQYRLLASFDFRMPEPAQMDAAEAKAVRVEDGAHAALDLTEFVVH